MSHEPSPGRRKFITNSVKGGLAITVGMSSASTLFASCTPSKNIATTLSMTGFDQQPLPYKYDALENVIDTITMEIHYSKQAAAY